MAFFEMAKTAIRTVIGKPATRRYPFVPAKVTSLSRGHVAIDVSSCISCGMCMKKCPSEAICVDKEEKTWTIWLRCIVCNSCVESCPVHCLTMDTAYPPARTVHSGLDVYHITYVKPEKPKKAESTEEKEEKSENPGIAGAAEGRPESDR